MLYRDIIKTLAKSRNRTIENLALSLGLARQATLSQRLKDSWNPGMKDTELLLKELGYKIVFVPEATKVNDDWFEPEFPERPVKES